MESLKKLNEKGAFHIFIGSFITKFAAFFGSVFIVRVLTKEEFGVLGYAENLFNYTYVLAGMGLANALLRYVILAGERAEKLAYYKYVVRFSTVFNVLLVVAAGALFVFYPHPTEFAAARYLVPLLLLSLPFRSLSDNQNSLQRAMFDNKGYAIWGSAISIAAVAVKFVLAWLFGLEGAVLSSLIVYAMFVALLAFYVRGRYFGNVSATALSRDDRKSVNQYSVQYMVTNGIWAIFMLNDVLLLGQMTGNANLVAEYKVAYVLPANLSLISASIGVFVTPYFVQHEKEPIWIRKAYKKVFACTAAAIGVVAAVIYIFAGPIISVLYGNQYTAAVPVMRVLLVAAFLNTGLRYTHANLLAAMGQVKPNMLVSLGGVLLQIIVSILVIPSFGAMGVAYTSVLVYALMAAALMAVFWQRILRSKRAENP